MSSISQKDISDVVTVDKPRLRAEAGVRESEGRLWLYNNVKRGSSAIRDSAIL